MENCSRFVVPKKVFTALVLLHSPTEELRTVAVNRFWSGGGGISESNACQQMRVEWVEVLSYVLEKNVALGRSRREGISKLLRFVNRNC